MSWTISRKLMAVTLVSAISLILLTVTIVIFALRLTAQVEESKERSAMIATAARIEYVVSDINRAVMDTLAKREERISDSNQKTFGEARSQLANDSADLKEKLKLAEDRALISGVERANLELLDATGRDLPQLVASRAANDQKFADLDDAIDDTAGQIGDILDQISEGAGNPEAGPVIQSLRQANSDINLAAMDAIVDRDDVAAASAFLQETVPLFAKSRENVAQLRRLLPGAAATLRDLESRIGTFEKTVGTDLLAAIEAAAETERQTVALDEKFDTITAKAHQDMEQLIARLEAASATATAATQQLLRILEWGALIFGTLITIVVIVATTTIGRSISRALRDFTRIMRELAGGDLNVTVTGKDRSDEIGEMAVALQVFKDNAVEIDGIRKAQQKAGEEIDAVVAAAAQGDFSARVEVAGKQGFMLSLAKSLNTLVETVNRGLSEAMTVAAALSSGDLSKRVQGEYHGMFERLQQSLNGMGETLAELVAKIRGATDMVNTAAGELGQGADDLAKRTESQAASLEETAAAMEEMTSTIRRNAESTQEANKLMHATKSEADHGGEIMTDTVTAMTAIETSARSISEIVSVIDDIALQTNLLALNASVEAARAGDAGRGFAVVASEVRSLAQRSGDAARQIRELIAVSTGHVESGVRLAKEAGGALQTIIGSVQRVATIMDDVSRASEEQSAGLGEVNSAIAQMDDMTQQNAALVEETAAAVQALGGQARELARLVGFFRAGEGESPLMLKAG